MGDAPRCPWHRKVAHLPSCSSSAPLGSSAHSNCLNLPHHRSHRLAPVAQLREQAGALPLLFSDHKNVQHPLKSLGNVRRSCWERGCTHIPAHAFPERRRGLPLCAPKRCCGEGMLLISEGEENSCFSHASPPTILYRAGKATSHS